MTLATIALIAASVCYAFPLPFMLFSDGKFMSVISGVLHDSMSVFCYGLWLFWTIKNIKHDAKWVKFARYVSIAIWCTCGFVLICESVNRHVSERRDFYTWSLVSMTQTDTYMLSIRGFLIVYAYIIFKARVYWRRKNMPFRNLRPHVDIATYAFFAGRISEFADDLLIRLKLLHRYTLGEPLRQSLEVAFLCLISLDRFPDFVLKKSQNESMN